MSLGVLDVLLASYLIDWSKSNSIVGVVSNRGRIVLEQQCVIFNFIMFIAGILVGIYRSKYGIALDLIWYKDDNGWKTVLWVHKNTNAYS